jgi:hypothetical protein
VVAVVAEQAVVVVRLVLAVMLAQLVAEVALLVVS